MDPSVIAELADPQAQAIREALWSNIVGLPFAIAIAMLVAGTILFMSGLSRFASVPFLVSVLVVTLGTTLPEMILVGIASQNNLYESANFFELVAGYKANILAYGIIIGSTAINLLFVMPIARFARSLGGNNFVVRSSVVFRDVLFLIAATIILLVTAYTHVDTVVPVNVGWLLIGFSFAYVVILTATERRGTSGDSNYGQTSSTGPNMLLISAGILMVGIVSYYLIQSLVFPAIDGLSLEMLQNEDLVRAEIFGLGFFIGFVVAMPELVSSIFYAQDKNSGTGLTTGNILTACILNLSVVAGLGIIIADLFGGTDVRGEKIAVFLDFDFLFPHLFFILLGSILLWVFFLTREKNEADPEQSGGTFSVVEGMVLIGLLLIYLCYLIGADWAVSLVHGIRAATISLLDVVLGLFGLN